MKNTPKKHQIKHQPVLLREVLEYLSPQPGESLLDVTAGYGGHSKDILGLTGSYPATTLVDRDSQATEHLKKLYATEDVEIINDDYLDASRKLLAKGKGYDLILADLGVSSPHLNDANRGFSFSIDGPLDMRMDQNQSLSASSVVNSYKEAELAKIIKNYGEDPRAKQIARLIVLNRPVISTQQLAEIIKRAWPGHSKHHPATKTFQAIRIVVNEELNQLSESLPIWIELLNPGGRIAIITFHSLEDRIVKQFLKDLAGNRYDAVLQLINKRPIAPGQNELVSNPRSRSAKLRVAAKINTERGSIFHAYTGKESLPGISS